MQRYVRLQYSLQRRHRTRQGVRHYCYTVERQQVISLYALDLLWSYANTHASNAKKNARRIERVPKPNEKRFIPMNNISPTFRNAQHPRDNLGVRKRARLQACDYNSPEAPSVAFWTGSLCWIFSISDG